MLKVKLDHRKVPQRVLLKGNSFSPIHYAHGVIRVTVLKQTSPPLPFNNLIMKRCVPVLQIGLS